MLPVEEGYSGDWKFEQGTDSDAVIIENAEKAADTAILMENGTSKEITGLTVYRYTSSSDQEERWKSGYCNQQRHNPLFQLQWKPR